MATGYEDAGTHDVLIGPRLQRVVAVLAQDAAQLSPPQLGAWRVMSEALLWRELSACILGSQVSDTQTSAALKRLEAGGVAAPWRITESGRRLESRIRRALGAPTANLGLPRYRFPRRAAAMLRQNVEVLYREERSLSALLLDESEARAVRSTLVQLLAGIGPKQASLFLLNVGASDDLAAIDRHLLKYLNLTRGVQVKAPTTLAAYEELEQELRAEAAALGVPLAVLDLTLWVMMRTWSGVSRSRRTLHSCGV